MLFNNHSLDVQNEICKKEEKEMSDNLGITFEELDFLEMLIECNPNTKFNGYYWYTFDSRLFDFVWNKVKNNNL